MEHCLRATRKQTTKSRGATELAGLEASDKGKMC